MTGAPLSDAELRAWAHEHLLYEMRQLLHAAAQLGERKGQPKDPDSNALFESWAVHVRCLKEFLWGSRGRYAHDAFAADFCAHGNWTNRPPFPDALTEIDDRKRLGRELVHLSYLRSHVPAEAKDWPVADVTAEIVEALGDLALDALPERLDDETRAELEDPFGQSSDAAPRYAHSVATAAFPRLVGS